MRRYAPMKASRGTVIPTAMRIEVLVRDAGCMGYRLSWPGDCAGALSLDHVRASHGIGMKSETSPRNLVSLCANHHRYKTEHGRDTRPQLLRYLEGVSDAA